MEQFNRLFKVGAVREYAGSNRKPTLWIEVKYSVDGRLSITGVHGPMANGDCVGGCGQCIDTLRELGNQPESDIYLQLDGSGKAFVQRLADVWDAWHLNDMRAACQHMKVVHGWDPRKQLTLYHWTLTTEVWQARADIKRNSARALEEGKTVTLTQEQQSLLLLPMEICDGNENEPSHHYRLNKMETKAAGWVYPADGQRKPTESCQHVDGLLTKACPTCNYKYGTKWLKEDVPDDVLEFLASIPDAPEGYPWKR